MQCKAEELRQIKTDSRYINIGALPSQFKGYLFDELYIRPFEIPEMRMLSRSVALNNVSHTNRAVDMVISQDVNELTTGDYYYVLMWLRLHSFPKTPPVVSWHCQELLPKAPDGKVYRTDEFDQLPQDRSGFMEVSCDTYNSEIVHKTNIDIITLPDDYVLPAGFDFPRVKHMEAVDEALKDPELLMLAPAAQWIVGETFEDKLKTLETANSIDMYETAAALNDLSAHGIAEDAVLKCRGCGFKIHYKLQLSARSFFR